MKKKKIYEYIGLIAIIISSFYFTNQVRLFILNKNPLVKTITAKSSEYNVASVNAIINDGTIIPGLNGKQVNIVKSFNNMKEFGIFNDTFLSYDIVKPKISLSDHKDNIIIKGNPLRREVSLLFEYRPNSINLENINIIINELNEYDNSLENINNIINSTDFKEMENELQTNKLNNNLCLEDNIHNCSGKLIIRPTATLTNSNYISVKNSIENGSIILIKKSVSLDTVNLLINYLNSKDIKIVYLSKLISENNDK